MGEEGAQRKLDASFSADVQGYGRLMADDEESTVRRINVYREVMTNLIQGNHESAVDAKGGHEPAEFDRVVDAVRRSVECSFFPE